MCFIFARSHSTSAPFPPQLFVELNELIVKDHEMRWKERARWIKFEEDVEEETGRWGKAHVASLSFRSLLELRRTITHGKQLLHARSAADAPVYLCPCVINRTHTRRSEHQKIDLSTSQKHIDIFPLGYSLKVRCKQLIPSCS